MQEAQEQAEEGQQANSEPEQDLQNRPRANSEAITNDPRGLRSTRTLAFRKYGVDGTLPVDPIYVYAKIPNRYRNLASAGGEQPLGRQEGNNGHHLQGPVTSGTTRVDYPQLPNVKRDAASHWTEAWVRKVGERLGLRLSKHDTLHFKVPIARRMGFKTYDPRLASPAMALAAIEQRDRLAKKVDMAKMRQVELTLQGTEPTFFRRKAESEKARGFGSHEEGRRWDKIGPKGRTLASSARKELRSAQLAVDDLEGADTRDGFQVAEARSARPHVGKSALSGTGKHHTEPPLQGLGYGFAETDEPPPQTFQGIRAPMGIRFTVRPTWLPFDYSPKKAENPEAGREPQKQRQCVTDIGIDSTSQLLDLAGDDASSKSPESGLLPRDQVDQAALSENSKPTNTFTDIFGMLFPQTTEPDSRPSQTQGGVGRSARSSVKRRARPETLPGGIYKKLFPDDFPEEMDPQQRPQTRPDMTTEQPSGSTLNEEDLVPPEESIFVSLRNEIRNWIPEKERKGITAPVPGEYGSQSTVLILSGLSNSLVDTDFYRILPEAKHIEGWAGGLVKVVQARDTLSHEPVGRYFLMFHSRPAADAYKAEILRLHSLSKRLLHSSTGTGPLDDAPTDPQPFLTEEEKAAVRSFTICPPTAPLRINVRIWNTNLLREIAQSANIADVVQSLRPDVSTPSKVLVTVNTIPGSRAGTGGGLTVDELWLTLRDDGRERGAPWILSNLKEGIMPVKLTSTTRHGKIDIRSEAVPASLEGPIYDELDMLAEPPPHAKSEPFVSRRITYDAAAAWPDRQKEDEIFDKNFFLGPESDAPAGMVGRQEKFNRFVVTFTQPAISRRFVRSWHKRAIWDAYEKRSVSIDAVALM